MRQLLYFSDYFKPVFVGIDFATKVIGKFFLILFRWHKEIKIIELEYSKIHQFNNSYLVVSYKFRNVLWYNFKGIRKTTRNEPVVLDIKNLKQKNVTLIVYGFFQKRQYTIIIRPTAQLDSYTFITTITGINQSIDLKRSLKPFIKKHPELVTPSVEMKIAPINLVITSPQIKPSIYN
jgi:hypothetical protein